MLRKFASESMLLLLVPFIFPLISIIFPLISIIFPLISIIKKYIISYPGPRGFSFFFNERATKRRTRVAKRRERKTSGYLRLESHFHADARVRIWPSGSDWLIFLQTRKSIWLVRLIGKHMIADLPLDRFVIKNLTHLTAGVCMKVRFKSKVTRGFSFSPLRGSLIGKKRKTSGTRVIISSDWQNTSYR